MTRLRQVVFYGALLGSLLMGSGCVEEIVDDGGVVTSIEVTPNEFLLEELTSTEKLTVKVTLSVDPVTVDRQESQVYVRSQQVGSEKMYAVPEDVKIEGDSLVFEGISYSWLQNLGVGSHNVGVEIKTEASRSDFNVSSTGQLVIKAE